MSGSLQVKKYRRIFLIAVSMCLVFLAFLVLQLQFRTDKGGTLVIKKGGNLQRTKLVAARKPFEDPDYQQLQDLLYENVQESFASSEEELEEQVSRPLFPDSGCYQFSPKGRRKKLPRELLSERKCKQRLPRLLIIGVKKCGTGALASFLSYHPNLTVALGEIHFFDKRWTTEAPASKYKHIMPYSSSIEGYEQVTMEKTPAYLMHPNVPERVSQILPQTTKFIIITCDPVKRTISDYVHMYLMKRAGFPSLPNAPVPYRVGRNYEDSVLVRGKVDEKNSLVTNGMYASHIINWSKYFPLANFYIVDGGEFKKDPIKELKKLEKFFGLVDFFKNENKYYNKKKGFYCPAFPHPTCVKGKGRRHPKVDGRVLEKLSRFYEPHNRQLEYIFNKSFLWAKTNYSL